MSGRVIMDQAALTKLFDSPDGPVGKELARRTIKVQRRARQLAPVDTGRLRSSIAYEVANEAGQLVGVVGTNVHYAVHLELGTSRMRARPYLRPALDAARR